MYDLTGDVGLEANGPRALLYSAISIVCGRTTDGRLQNALSPHRPGMGLDLPFDSFKHLVLAASRRAVDYVCGGGVHPLLLCGRLGFVDGGVFFDVGQGMTNKLQGKAGRRTVAENGSHAQKTTSVKKIRTASVETDGKSL